MPCSKTPIPVSAVFCFLHDGTCPVALTLTSAGSLVVFVDCLVTCLEPSLLSVRLPVCSNVCKSGISPTVLFSSYTKKKEKASLVPETEVAHGRQPTPAWFAVCSIQAQSIIKVIVSFHRERQALLFFLLLSVWFVCHISAPQSFGRGA